MYDERDAVRGTGKLFFIVNPSSHSGKGIRLWKQVECSLQERKVSYEVLFSQKRGDIARFAEELTQEIPEGENRTIVVLGGDGTVNEAMQGIRNFANLRFGYIPTGSSNDLARDIGISKNAKKALEAILDGQRQQRMDLGCVSWKEDGAEHKRYFLVSCGIGYDAAICREALSSKMKDVFNRIGLGKITYLGIGLKQMVAAKYVKAQIRLDGGKVVPAARMLFAVSMSHRYEGGGFCFCPKADAADGLLDLCLVSGLPKWKFPIVIPFALFGKHGMFKGVDHYRAASVEIKTSEPMWVQTDGEIPGKFSKIKVTVEKQKLRFIY